MTKDTQYFRVFDVQRKYLHGATFCHQLVELFKCSGVDLSFGIGHGGDPNCFYSDRETGGRRMQLSVTIS